MSDPQPSQEQSAERTGSRFSVLQILGLLVLVAFVVFLVENNHSVTVRLIVPEREISLSIALLIAGVLGAIGLWLVQHRRRRK